MSKYTQSLFESIKDAINKNNTTTESRFKDFMKFEVDKTYVVRLLPYVENPERTFFHYYSHTWKSVLNNNIISVLCPNTYGESCPIDEYRSKVYMTKDDSQIEKIRPIKRNENWLVNAYVIKDPTNPENEGKIKIIRYGRQLAKIIDAAISGDDSDEFGPKVFDLSENGCNLKIKVEKNEGGYATYVGSKFTSPSRIENLEDPDKIYASTNNLDDIFEHKSAEDIKNLLSKHFLGEDVSETPVVADTEDDDFDSYAEITNSKTSNASNDEESEEDKKMQEILNDL